MWLAAHSDAVFILVLGIGGVWAILEGLRAEKRCARERERRRAAADRRKAGPQRACPHPGCGYLNRPEARYCARCGTALGPPTDVDRYG